MLQQLQTGGVLVWPLLFCSIVALAIIMEKLWSLRTHAIIKLSDYQAMLGQLPLESTDTRIPFSDIKVRSLLGYLVVRLTEMRNDGWSQKRIETELEHEGQSVVHKMEQRLNWLGIIATITPLIGLLGTVLGMIKIFRQMLATGLSQPELLAGGISEALLTTALGLSIAIPCLIAYHLFEKRIEVLSEQLERHSRSFLHQLEHS